ncbi:MAG: Protein FecR [Pseudomonas citronellolis]|nr:MAG: Protein FecR [Pseudomonas citronellolis]
MMTPQQERQRVIDELAAKWFSRQRATSLEAGEQAAFSAWLAEDPTHARAYAEIESLWHDFDELPRPTLAQRPRVARGWPRLAAACAVFGLLMAAVPWGEALRNPQWVQDSAPGEQREVRLEDGSRVFLAGGSSLRVDFSQGFRDVRLLHGEAFFQVAHDRSRPFRVRAGDSQVTVVGTQFDVRLDDLGLQVAVREGRVLFQAQTGEARQEPLLPGDRASVDSAGQRLEVDRVPPESIARWRDGLLAFRERPLDELVRELSSYRSEPIRLGDPRLAERRLSGSVRISRLDDFLTALPALTSVRVQHEADGSALILPN